MCGLVFLFVFLIAPLYHTQRWLTNMIEEKGQESLYFRIPYIVLYLVAWIGGFGVGLALKGQGLILQGLFGAFGSVSVVVFVFFMIAAMLPNRRRAGKLYYASEHGPDDDELDEFRRSRRRAKREQRLYKERLREQNRRKQADDDADDDDLPVLRPRG